MFDFVQSGEFWLGVFCGGTAVSLVFATALFLLAVWEDRREAAAAAESPESNVDDHEVASRRGGLSPRQAQTVRGSKCKYPTDSLVGS